MEDFSEARVALTRRFGDFLEREFIVPGVGPYTYQRALQDQLYEASDGEKGKGLRLKSRRLVISEYHLREFDESLLQQLLDRPVECLPAFEDALRNFVTAHDEPLAKLLEAEKERTGEDGLYIGLKGDFGSHEVSSRELTSAFLNRLVCVFGIVTKCSLVRPKLMQSVHYSDVTKNYVTQEYRDVTANRGAPTSTVYPQYDASGNPLTTEYGLCRYVDNQMITMQELPETAPPGQLPHSVEVILEADLVDKVKPGDRISVVGVYKPLATRQTGNITAVFKAVLVGITVQKLNKETLTKVTIQETRAIKDLARRSRVLDLLGASLAPSIYGHDIIKKGLVLLLFGGMEKTLDNGTHLRGDVNCLMVGDPGVAKSQLLRAVMSVAPHAVSTTGRGSSGVGLTAAVTSDSETGEKRLEAGAMVLADRGVCCIDEFDKMSDQDRVAIHEVMEQQTVTIAKAGIHTSLNARCAVLAAANPLYGSYDRSISVMRNVNLPDSLLSRFDMLFVVLDTMNDERDRQVALHVLRQHQYRPPGDDGRGVVLQETIHDRRLSLEPDAEADVGRAMWLKVDARLHGAAAESDQQVLTTDFLRKYVILARRKYARSKGVKMTMTDEALDHVISYYVQLRAAPSSQKNFTVTARSLETLIRLATAHCKVRLSERIELRDVTVACAMMDHVMRCEIVGPEEKGGAAQADSDDDVQEDGGEGNNRRGSKRRRTGQAGAADGPAGADGEAQQAQAAQPGPQALDVEGAAGPSGSGGAAATASAGGVRIRSGAAGETAAVLQAAGIQVVPADAPLPGADDGTETVTSVEQLSDADKELIIDVLREYRDQYGDELVEVTTLKADLAPRGLRASLFALCDYVAWVSENFEDQARRKVYLPNIAYDAESRSFMFMA